MQLFRTDRKLTPSWELVRPSILLLRENIWAVMYLAFLPSLLTIVALVLMGASHSPQPAYHEFDGRTVLGIGLLIVGAIWSLLAFPGVIVLQTRAIRGEHPSAVECFKQGLPRLLPFVGMSIVAGVIVVLGLFALIIPGLILIRGFFLAQYYLVDGKLGPIEALKQSYADSKPNAGYIWGIIGVEMAFAILSSMVGYFPVIGYILSLAAGLVYAFAPALRYGEIARNLPVRKA